jgi:hypothetical protein
MTVGCQGKQLASDHLKRLLIKRAINEIRILLLQLELLQMLQRNEVQELAIIVGRLIIPLKLRRSK